MIDQVNKVITLLARNQTLISLLDTNSNTPCIDSNTFGGLVKRTVGKHLKIQLGELEEI